MLQDQTFPVVPEGVFPPQLSLAMAYVPFQSWETLLPETEALQAGSAFPSLVKPFGMEKGGVQHAIDTAGIVHGKG